VSKLDRLISQETEDDLRVELFSDNLSCYRAKEIIEENEDTELEQLGEGTARCVFDTDELYTSVLKVAKTGIGIMQNRRAETATRSIPMYEAEDTFAVPGDFTFNNVAMTQEKVEPLETDEPGEDIADMAEKLVDVAVSTGITCNDFDDPENLGQKDQDVVLKDMGSCTLGEEQDTFLVDTQDALRGYRPGVVLNRVKSDLLDALDGN